MRLSLMKKQLFGSLAVTAACGIGWNVQAAADSTPAVATESSSELTEIVVTATRREESLSKVPVAVSAVSAADLEKFDIKTTEDLARTIPAFQATADSQSGSPVFTLRGVGFNTVNVTSTAPIGLYVDEVAYAYPLMADGELFDLERVEVLKGPQGTLYGRNTTGGLIDYVPAKPTDSFQAGVTAGFGNFASYDYSGFVSGPLSDTIKGRVAFASENRDDGWQHSITRDDTLGKLHRYSVRGILDWTPNDRFKTEISVNAWQKKGDTQAGQAVASIDANPSAAVLASINPHPTSNYQADWTPASDQPFTAANGIIRPLDEMYDKFYSAVIRATLKLNEQIDLVSLTSYNHLDFYQFMDSSGVQTESLDAGTTGHIGSFSEEIRLVGDFKQFDWSVGGYFAHDTTFEELFGFAGENPTISELKGLALILPSAYTPDQILNSYRDFGAHGNDNTTVASAFANANYQVLPDIKLNLGGRYTEDKVTYQGGQYDHAGQNLPIVNTDFPVLIGSPLPTVLPNGVFTVNATDNGFQVANEKQSQNNFAFRATIDWTPTSTSLYYASVSQGFKSGVFPVLNASAIGQLAPISQEKLVDYEIGEKLSLFDRRLQLNSSAFYYDYTNRQVYGQIPDVVFGTLPAIVNVPKSEIYGIDGDLTYAVTSDLRAMASGSWLESKIKDYSGFDPFGVKHDYRGAPLPFAPHYSLFASVTQSFHLTNSLALEVAPDVSYQAASTSYIGSDPNFRIAPYALAGASATLRNADQKWHVTAYARNVFDRYYWTSTQISHDTIVRYAGMPTMFGIRATWDF